MKKFLFIIPKVFLITLLLLLANSFKVTATSGVDGCHIVTPGGDHRNYHTAFSAGAGSPTEWITTSGSPGFAGYNENTSSRCISEVGPPCTVYLAGSTALSKTIVFTGTYAIMINCPIDDYIPVFFVLVATIGFFRIRKFATFKSENESKSNHRSV